VRLTAASGGRAFSAKACGAKVHVIYDADADRPIYAARSAAKVNDITAAHAISDRGRRHLRLRPRLPRLCLVGRNGRFFFAAWVEALRPLPAHAYQSYLGGLCGLSRIR
jgi:hypothetical protein